MAGGKSERRSTRTENLEGGDLAVPFHPPTHSSPSAVNPPVYSRDDTDMLLARSGVRFRAHVSPVLPMRVLARTCHATTALRRRCWATSRRRRGANTSGGRAEGRGQNHLFLEIRSRDSYIFFYFYGIFMYYENIPKLDNFSK